MRSTILAIGGALTLVAVSTTAWVGCETPLPPAYQLTDARILAIKSDPPDLVPDGSVGLSALVYLPPGAPTPTYQWSWCAAVGSTLQCSVDAGQLTQLLDQDGSFAVNVDYSLGTGAQAVLSFPVDLSVLQSACGRALSDAGQDAEAGSSDEQADSGEGGLPAFGIGGLDCNSTSWTIYVLLNVGVGGTSLQAARSLTAYLTAPSLTNTNPTVAGLSPFTPVAADAGPLGIPGELEDGSIIDATIGAAGDAGVIVAAQVPLSAADLYTIGFAPQEDQDASDAASLPPCPADAATDEQDCTHEAYEALTLSWYVQGGLLDHATTTLPSARLGAPQDWNALVVNQWAAPAGSTQFALVVRDNRGGVGWWELPVHSPPSGAP